MHRDRPAGSNPCRPVHWVMAEPAAEARLLATKAFSPGCRRRPTLVFVHEGTNSEAYAPDRPLVQPARYGERYPPVLIAWSDDEQSDELDGPVAAALLPG